MEGFVYFFKHNEIDAIKIGLTHGESIQRRFTVFSTYSPFGAKIIGYIKTDDCILLEKKIHRLLFNKRISTREWFLISEEDCKNIIERFDGIIWQKEPDDINKVCFNGSKKDIIIKLHEKGMKQVYISKKLKTPPSYVSKIINNYIKNISQNT